MLVRERVGERVVTFRREPGHSPTLVFLHGAGSNHKLHDRLVDALPGWQRMALDFPGRAGTEGPALDSVADMAEFVESVIDAVVDGPYVLIGYSLGGAVAMQLACRGESDRLAGLVLIATGARLRVQPALLGVHEAAAHAERELITILPRVFEEQTRRSTIEQAARDQLLTPASTASMDWRACDGFDRLDSVERIVVPTLVLAGSDDLLAPPMFAAFLHERIRGSELHVLEGARHMLVMERPHELALRIHAFAARLRLDATDCDTAR